MSPPLNITALLLLFALISCESSSKSQEPYISDARIRMPPPGRDIAAGYMRLENPSSQTLRVTGLHSDVFKELTIHQTIKNDGVARMREVNQLTIKPGDFIDFMPGGLHLMLIGYQTRPDGSKSIPIEITLTADDGTVHSLHSNFSVEAPG